MSLFPYTRLALASGKALIVSGHHYHVLNAQDGELAQSTTRLGDDLQTALVQSGPIRCTAVDSTLTHVATTADDKKLKIWRVETLELLNERELPKKPTEVAFTRDGQTIVISDKFGDVFSYPLYPEHTPEVPASDIGASKRGSLNAHENPSNGTLVLGHASLLTTFLLTPDERYIVTADRDEHIRVSWYPQGYNIERYCLGHETYVSALHIPSFKESALVSGGGDPMLKVWDWMSGRLLANISIFNVAEPYIRVRAPKRKRGWSEGDEDGETGEGAQPQKGKGKGRRGRGKGKGKVNQNADAGGKEREACGTPAEERGDQPMADADTGEPADESNRPAASASEETVLAFVVYKIQSVDRGEHGRFIVFSVVGASALFYTPFPEEGVLDPPPVHVVEFPVPVVDFTVGPDGAIWTLLDAEWAGAQSLSEKPQFVRLLTWNENTTAQLSESSADSPLLDALNSKCLVSATPEELKKLDLYSDLSSLPKNVDPDHDALIRDTLSEAAAFDPDAADAKKLTLRELGRLKKKKALLAKIQEREEGAKRASREGSEAVSEREVKRARSESESGTGVDEKAGDGHGGDGNEFTEGRDDVRDVEMAAS
ncbi:WD40 repeat-like protein [Dichomitus squalens]|uniref:WD40 repeat-like protein n=1 Tax=Dichomitus squalens TaxID=114155 RepID=A0A4Q9MSR9_9APHY|nr:WD40 repeat-like protein [Dichomitus squalens]